MSSKKDTWSGEHYTKHFPKDKGWIITYLKNLKFNGNKTILDVGCGNGKVTARIAKMAPEGKVIGIDSSLSMIQTAKQTYSDIPNLSFQIADATNFTFNQTFDYVFSFFVFHWIENQLAVLNNIKNVLKPSGKIVIVMTAYQEESPIDTFFENIKPESMWDIAAENRKKTYHPKSAEEFEKLLDKSGFKNKNITIVQKTTTFNTFEKMIQSLMRWVPSCTKLSHDQALKFSKKLAQYIYDQQNKKLHESTSYQSKFLLIEAQ